MSKPVHRRALMPLVAVVSFAVVSSLVFVASAESAELTGPYLGQACPGSSPRLFAPGVVSRQADFEHSAATFSPDGQEVYWCTNVGARTNPPGVGQKLYVMRQIDGVWTSPEIAPFTEDITDAVQRPVFSPDGMRLYFEVFGDDDSDIYVVERQGDGWSAPVFVSSFINTFTIERLHCVTSDGSMIFSRSPFTSREKMYLSRFVDGAFTEPEQLGMPYDSTAYELALVVAPDDSYMLIALTRTGLEDELYISYKQPDGSWSERIRTRYECGGFLALSPDGEYLFFLGEEGIYWVDTSFVDRRRPSPEGEET